MRKRTRVEGWVVVVTGASSGNGKAISLALASKGARVVLAARRARLLEAVAREAEDLGGEALLVPCDVTVPEQVQNVARAAVERWGRIDAWVNCAGVIVWSLFEDTEIEEFRRTLDVNLMGSVYGAQAALPVMRRQGSGVIVNIASIAALVAFPTQTAYAVSKAGLLIFGEALRRELRGSGVRVCQVLPTGVNTSGFLHTRTRGFRFPRRITWLLQDPENVARAVWSAAWSSPGCATYLLACRARQPCWSARSPPVLSTSSAALSFGSSRGGDAWSPQSTTSSRPRSGATICAARAGAPTTIPRPTWTSNPKVTEKFLRRWCSPDRQGARPAGLALGVRTFAKDLVFVAAVVGVHLG